LVRYEQPYEIPHLIYRKILLHVAFYTAQIKINFYLEQTE